MRTVVRIPMRLAVLILMLLPAAGIAAVPSLDEVRRLVREFRLDDALVAIDARLAVDPADRQARFLKGVVHAERKEDEAAIAIFSALARDYPDLPEPYNNLAVLHASRGDFELARDALLKAINTHPSYATAHENLGDIYAKMAGLAYGRALSLDTANAAAKDKLALIDDLFTRGGAAPPMVAARAPEPAPRQAALQPPAAAAAPAGADPAEAAAVPAAAAAAPGTATRATERDAIAALESWADAWSAQDVDRYLAHYLEGVSPEPGVSRRKWEATRRLRLSKPEFITVTIAGLEVHGAGADRLDVTFVQSYRSNTYADRVRKRVSLEHTAGGWKIREERTLATL